MILFLLSSHSSLFSLLNKQKTGGFTMNYSKLVVAIFMILVSFQLASALAANVAEGVVVLRPDVPLEGMTIERVITAVNRNDFDVNVEIIEGDDPEDLIEVIDRYITIGPDQEGEARFKIHLKYGGNYERKLIASFTPKDPALGTSSLGMVSNIKIYATGLEAPDGYGVSELVEPTEIVEPTEPVDPTGPVEPTEPQDPETQTSQPTTQTSNVWVGIIVVLVVVLLGAGLFALVWKLGLLK